MVFVIDRSKKPLAPCTHAKARMLLKTKQAVVHRLYPFAIRLKKKVNHSCSEAELFVKTFTIKIDPGATVTGIAIVDKEKTLYFIELVHRGATIKKSLLKRVGVRRSRRNRKTRYRAPRFQNRTRPKGWLAPSVRSRADNIISWVKKLSKWIPLEKGWVERVSFDTHELTAGQKLYGEQYQQGPLYQQKLRQFIFQKFDSTCCYCEGASGDTQLEVEHLHSKSTGGTNSTRNLVLSCRTCNEKKGKLTLEEFGKVMGKDYSHLEKSRTPKAAAIIQSARNYTIQEISKIIPVSTGEGWETSLNRQEMGLPKEHYYDAMCVGNVIPSTIATQNVLIIQAQGRGSRLMTRVDKHGFPRQSAKSSKSVHGFQTGDIVKAVVPEGKHAGVYMGRVAIRATGSFNIATSGNTIQGIKHQYCRIVQRNDGYTYLRKERAASSPCLKTGVSAA